MPASPPTPRSGPTKVKATELISSGLEWLESEPETLFVEVPAFADFMLRRVVLEKVRRAQTNRGRVPED